MQAFRRFWSHPNLLKDSRGGRLFWLVDAFLIARGYFGTTSSMPVSCAYISMQQLATLRGRGDFPRSQIFRVHSPSLGGPQHSNIVLDVFVASRTSKSIHLDFLRQQQLPTAFLCILLGKWRRQMSTSNLSLSVSDRLRWWLTFLSRVRSCIFYTFFKEAGRGECQPPPLDRSTLVFCASSSCRWHFCTFS